MATYKYRQNFFEGSSAGYVQYNITPDFGSVLTVGDMFEITGQMYSKNVKLYGAILVGGLSVGSTAYEFGRVEQICNKGGTAAFSMLCRVTQELADAADARGFAAYIRFILAGDAAFTPATSTVADAGQKLSLLTHRLSPVINIVSIADESGALAHFGGAVSGKSDLYFEADVTLDPLDAALTISMAQIQFGSRPPALIYDISGNRIHFGIPDFDGEFDSFTLDIADSEAMSARYTGGAFAIYPYTSPRLESFADADLAERYKVTLADDGEEYAELADDGKYLWANFRAEIASVNGKNAWVIERSYAEFGNEPANTAVALSGTDGETLTELHNQNVFPRSIEFQANERYTVKLVLSDFFESVTLSLDIDKAGGYFNVEKYGIAAGMRSTATQDTPKFESAYPIYPYAGIEGVNNFAAGEVKTGGTWIDSKPIYRNVVKANYTASAAAAVAIIADLDTVIDINGVLYDGGGACYPLTFYWASSNCQSIYVNAANGVIIKGTRNLSGYIILYYTKTTD